MKRIIALLIITVLCLGMLASCELVDKVKDMIGIGGEQPAEGPTVADAISFLDDIYKTKKETTMSDFDVVGQVKIDGVTFPVVWTCDNDKVSIRESTKVGMYTVDLPDTNTEEFSYTLTATITVDDVSENKSYTFKMPAIDNSGVTSTPVEGVAYKLFLLQGSFGQRYYALATAQQENKFINTTLDPKEAVDFYVEKVDGGYKWYTDVDGVKTYVYAKVERTEENGTVKYSKYIGFNTEEGSVFSYNENKGGVWTVTVEDLVWGVGTYGTYTTISISEDSYFTPEKVGDSQFVVQFMTSEYANTLAPDQLPEADTDAKKILDQLYALADGESASGNFQLTGTITALDSYGNPTIVVEGYDNMPVYCYKLTDDKFVVGATVTVSALQMKNYGGTYEFMSCTLDSIVLPGDNGNPDATEMTIPEVLAAAEGTAVKVTGTVESFYYAWDDNYGNCSVYIVDDAGNKLLAFRLKTKVAVGDSITVTGTVAVYNGTNQIGEGCTAVINSSGNVDAPSTELSIVTSPEVGVAYKFGLFHGNENATVYFNGQNYNNYAWYLAYSASGVDVYLEAVEGVESGYRLFFYNGDAKTYIRVYQDSRAGHENDGTLELTTSVPEEYFTFNTEYNTLIWTNANGAESYLGSSGTYKSISCSNISYITNETSYIAHLYAEGATGEDGGNEGGENDGDNDGGEVTPPAGPTEMTIPEVLAAAEGTAVKVTGTVESFYYAWDDSWGNCSVYIVDDAGNKLLAFRLKTKVAVGDKITVTGTVAVYNGTNQIGEGCTATIDTSAGGEDSGEEGGEDTTTVTTIPDALAATVGTNAVISGQVIEINQVWDSGYSNMSVTIADADGNELYVYRMSTQVVAGDFVTITGTVGEYNGAKQIAQGATAVITGHEDLVVDANCKVVSFADVANRTVYTTEQQVWVVNGVTITNNKAASTSNVGDYSAPARFYKSTDLKIEHAGMTKIVFHLNSGKPASGLTDSLTGIEGITVETDGYDITVIFDSAVDSFYIAAMAAQIRVDSIDVYTA